MQDVDDGDLGSSVELTKLDIEKYPNKLGRIAPLNLWYGD